MTGGKARPRKDKALKVSAGELVSPGQILVRGLSVYKAGKNTKGIDPIFALCAGKVYFTRKKTPKGRPRTFVNVQPLPAGQ